MPAALEGPCQPWLEWADLDLPGRDVPEIPDEATRNAILDMATRTLWERTCKQFGTCAIERSRVWPVCRHRYSWTPGFGYWLRAGACSCGLGNFVPLGDAPVVSIEGVWEAGVELDPSDYRVDDWKRLVRTDGNTWVNGASLAGAQGDPGTLEVAWTYGLVVPDDALLMCKLVAYQVAADVLEQCGTPSSNATRVTREGVEITITPPKGDTGIALVERWLSNFHCGGGAMFDPGQHPTAVRYNTAHA